MTKVRIPGGATVHTGGAVVPNLAQVLDRGNDGGGLQVKNIADPSSNQDAVTLAYFNAHSSVGVVSSVFGRVGAIIAVAGDYTTSLVTEGSNLYYTAARFNSAFSGKSTSDLTEGSNLYFTTGRVLATALSGLSISGSSISSTDTVLQAFGKLQNQINGVLGGAVYQGVWNATTNSPTLTSSTGTKGYYYVVSVAGSTNLDGITDWKIGDWAIFNGATWDKVDNTDAISSFNGSVGAITYTPAGTSNRITVTGAAGLAPTFDISSSYVGQTSITTLGTIGTGVWNGTAIGDTYISSASTWNAKQSAITFGTGVQTALGVNIGSAGAPVLFNGAGGTPSSLTLTNATGLPPTSGIVGWPANASGVLTNNGSGTLSWGAGSSALTVGSTTITSGTTTRILYDNAGTLGEYSTIPVANGGTNLASYTAGDLLYASGTTTLSKLGIGSNNTYLNSNGTTPSYSDFPSAARKAFAYTASTSLIWGGDSFTAGSNATSSYTAFPFLVSNQLNMTATNYGVSGKGWYHGVTTQIFTNISTANTVPVIMSLGLNDIRRMASNVTANTKTLEKLKCGVRATAAVAWLTSAVAANDAGVTTGGVWSTTSGIGDYASAKLSGLVRTSTANGATLTYTFTIANTNQAFVIGTFATDESLSTGGDWTYAIDGGSATTYTGKNKTDGITDGTNNNSLMPNAVFITGLSVASHTIVITTTSTATARIDYFGITQNLKYAPPVIINSVPYLDATGYAVSPSTGGSDGTVLEGTNALLAAVNEFSNAPIFFNDVNDIYNLSNGLSSSDHVHPNDTGHKQYANSILRVLKPVVGQNGLVNPTVVYDNSSNAVNAYLGTVSKTVRLGANYDGVAGTVTNASYPGAAYILTVGASTSQHDWYGGTTNGSLSASRMTLSGAGDLSLNANGSQLTLPNSSNKMFVGMNSDTLVLSVNRNFSGGTFTSASKAASQMVMNGSNGDGSIQFYAASANNTTPTNSVTIVKTGIQVSGSASFNYVAKTANYTLTTSDFTVNCTANSFTITLPTSVGASGRVYVVKNTGSGTITLATTSSQTIDGTTPGTLGAGPTVIRLISDNANWITF